MSSSAIVDPRRYHESVQGARTLAEWMASDLSKLDLLVIQIDGLHVGNDLMLVAALGIDAEGYKHPLALVEGPTENAAVVQALLDNLIARAGSQGLPALHCRWRRSITLRAS